MPKRVNAGDILSAKNALEKAKQDVADALGMLPAPNSNVSPEPGGGIVGKVNDARVEIQSALNTLGGRPCGGGRPC